MKPNLLPPAVIILDHTNPVDFSREAAPILDNLVVSYLRKQYPLSGHHGPYTLTEVGQVTDPATGQTHAITEHNYSGERQLECLCADFEAGKPCVHVAAIEAVALAEAA